MPLRLDSPGFDNGARAVLECADNLAFMKTLSDESMKLVVTSPPYNLGKDYEARTSLDAWLAGQERVIGECVRLLHPRGSICWQVGNHVHNGEIVPLDTLLYPLFRARGLNLRNRIRLAFRAWPALLEAPFGPLRND